MQIRIEGLKLTIINTLNLFSFFFFTAEEMNKADEELRETIKKLWPFQSKKMLNLLVAPAEGEPI